MLFSLDLINCSTYANAACNIVQQSYNKVQDAIARP